MHTIVTVVDSSEEPSFDLADIDNVVAELALDLDTAGLDALAVSITRQSQIIAALSNRVFASQTVVQGFWLDHTCLTLPLFLARYPVTEITEVTVGGAVVAADDYRLDAAKGLLWFERPRHWACEAEVSYTGGYLLPGEAPALLEQAVIELIREQRRIAAVTGVDGSDLSVRSTTHGDTSVTWASSSFSSSSSASFASDRVKMLIEPYKARFV